MRTRERLRKFTSLSWVISLPLALGIYALMMSFAAQKIPPIMKWLLAPIFSALIVAALISNFERYQLVANCGERDSFRIDSFLTITLLDGAVILVIFAIWSSYLFYRRGKRLKLAAE